MEREPFGRRPAFPCAVPALPGMTYRQWLVGQALKGVLTQPVSGGIFSAQEVARRAIDAADAVLMELTLEENAATKKSRRS